MLKKKVILILSIFLILLSTISCAHSGRTDSNGGHYDRSTGEYHYHHGYSAHQHPNGICPYESPKEETVVEEKEIVEKNDKIDDKDIENNNLKGKIEYLNSIIKNYENTIADLDETSSENRNKIKELEETQKMWHIIYIGVIVLLIIALYSMNKDVKEKNK